MAVNLTNAESALKSYYLEAVSEQLDNASPFLAKIKKSTENVYGKDVRKLVVTNLNGGIGAGTEDGSLPTANPNSYIQLTATLKNLYGTIEISDKAIRASENNSGAFVNLLNAEMEGLIKASKFNFSRMLFGDGTGKLSKVTAISSGHIFVDQFTNFVPGMIVDFCNSSGVPISGMTGKVIIDCDKASETIYFGDDTVTTTDIPVNSIVVLQGSYNKEITGLEAIFSNSTYLYGAKRTEVPLANPYKVTSVGSISESAIQTAIDAIEERCGNTPNFIITSWGVRRALQALFSTNKRIVDTVELAGGYKAMSYNGIPIVTDRFCPAGTMYLLNTDDFCLNQLCDWQWLSGDDGKVLKQIPGKPVYTATLVKYAELLCSRPFAQGKLTGITEA